MLRDREQEVSNAGERQGLEVESSDVVRSGHPEQREHCERSPAGQEEVRDGNPKREAVASLRRPLSSMMRSLRDSFLGEKTQSGLHCRRITVAAAERRNPPGRSSEAGNGTGNGPIPLSQGGGGLHFSSRWPSQGPCICKTSRVS